MTALFRRLMFPIWRKLWHFMYPVAAQKSIEEWGRVVELEFALELIYTNPESAQPIAAYYIQLAKDRRNQSIKKWGVDI